MTTSVASRLGVATIVGLARICRIERRQAVILVLLTGAGVVFDATGLAMLFPIGEYLLEGGDMAVLTGTSRVWQYLQIAFGTFGMQPSIGAVVGVSVLLLLGRQIVTYCRLVYQSALTYLIARRLRQAMFEKFLSATLSRQERLTSGPFANAMTTETTMAAQAVTAPVEFLNGGVLMLAYFGLLFWISPVATAVVLVVLAGVAFGLKGLLQRVRMIGHEIVSANAAYAQHFLQRCRSARLIRLAHTESRELAQADRLLHQQEHRNVDAVKVIALTEVGVEPLALMIAIPLLVGAVVVYDASLSAVGMFFIVLARLAPMVRQVARSWQSYLKVRASADNVLAQLVELSAVRESGGGVKQLQAPVRSIRFEQVGFRYPEARHAALAGLDLVINGSQMTAIVGSSGSGKSTLIDMIPRLRTPTSGRIKINDVAIEEYELASLRRGCAFVSQTPLLLEGTIAEQIRYGAADADNDAVRRAAEMANAHDFISALPDGYESRLGEGGVGLSGGQRQRIELARALVTGAPILILDEPTSSVDGESAHQIERALERIRAETDTSIVIVGHQLGAMKACDKIVVLDQGRVAAEGTHRNLVGREGWYRDTFRRQAQAADADLRGAAVAGE